MTALTILGGLSMFSTLFILTALVAAKKTAPQPGEGLGRDVVRRVAVAMFARGGNDRPSTIAQAARTIYDGFTNLFTWPRFGGASPIAGRN